MHLDRLRQFANTFTNDKTRAAHDPFDLYHFLAKSFSTEGLVKVTLHIKDYTIQGTYRVLQILKVIIKEIHINNNATIVSTPMQLSSIGVYITMLGHNIDKFNMYVNSLVKLLAQ